MAALVQALLRCATRFWPAVALAASASMLAAAHAFERFGGYAPCALCLRQREVYWAALGLAAAVLVIGAVVRRPVVARVGAILLGLTFLIGAVVAGYHAGVEWKFWPGPSTCGTGVDLNALTPEAMAGALDGKQIVVPCDEAAWRMAGLSMAGYNVLISLALAGLSFAAAAPPGPRQEERDERDG